MTYDNIDASNSSTTSGKSSEYRCFRCGVQIYFTSNDVETPGGKPTKDPITGKYKILDPVTKEYHLCKSSDIETFKETEEYKQRLAQWKANQQNDQSNGNASATKGIDYTSTTYDIKNAIIEQLLSDIDQIKMDVTAIKNALKIDSIGSGEAES